MTSAPTQRQEDLIASVAEAAEHALAIRLLSYLLEAYERSSSYGTSGPWRRAVIVKCEAAVPEAFSAEGAEALEELGHAARALQTAGVARVEWSKGWAAQIPHQLRMGPDELPRAEALGRVVGYPFLGDHLARISEEARLVASDLRTKGAEVPRWILDYLERIRLSLLAADTTPLGVARESFKALSSDVLDALRAAVAIACGEHGWERAVSQRVFADTKRLAALRSRIAQILVRADPRWDGEAVSEAAGVLSHYDVRRQPPTLILAGVGTVRFGDSALRLEDMTPCATLPSGWSGAVARGLLAAAPKVITTVENLYAFLAYVEEAGGPQGLGDRGEVACYTAGNPAPSLVELLKAVRAAQPSATMRHWGDADVGGLEIWRYLRRMVGAPFPLFRMSAQSVRSAANLGSSLSAGEHTALIRLCGLLRAELNEGIASDAAPVGADRQPGAQGADLPPAIDLIETMLELGVKVEQEAC